MSYVLRKIESLINGLTHVGSVLGGLFTGVMTFTVTYAVVMRYALNQPVGWSEEISTYLMIWAAFLGAAYALKEDAHIGVDLLLSKLPEKMKPCFHLFHCVVGIIFCSILFLKGLELVQFSISLNNRSIAIDFPLFIPQLAVPVGSALLFLQFFTKAVKLIPWFKGKTGSI
ncbi:MAG: TRAP transporter small permease [Syntrophaceae bacterium]|nr:TRAP transporter small permease [Syntrophaceae bacterium]